MLLKISVSPMMSLKTPLDAGFSSLNFIRLLRVVITPSEEKTTPSNRMNFRPRLQLIFIASLTNYTLIFKRMNIAFHVKDSFLLVIDQYGTV